MSLTLCNSGRAEQLHDVRFEAQLFDHSTCVTLAKLERDERLTQDELNEALRNLFGSLARDGYPLARLDSVQVMRMDEQKRMTIFLNESDHLRLGSILNSDGEPSSETALNREIRLSESMLISMAEDRLDTLTKEGFPFAQVTIIPETIIRTDEGLSADISLKIDRGPFMRIGRIKFSGRSVTRAKTLTLESRLKRGDVFNSVALTNAERQLERLAFIKQAGPAVLRRESPGILEIDIPIEERPANSAYGAAALSPDGDGPTGELTLSFGNLLGTGRRLHFEWMGMELQRKGIRVEYLEPWLLGRPLQASIALSQWTTDSSSTITSYHQRLEWRPSFTLSARLGTTWETIRFPISTFRPDNSKTIWIEAGFKYDGMDHLWNPTDGLRLSVTSATGRRSVEDDDAITIRREDFALSGANLVTDRLALYGNVSVSDLAGDAIVIDELPRIGGTGSIRGYNEGNWLARGVLRGAIEFRWRPDPSAYLGLFVDAAHIYRIDERVDPGERTITAAGISSQLETRAGRLGLDIGLGIGEPARQARLHFLLNTRF